VVRGPGPRARGRANHLPQTLGKKEPLVTPAEMPAVDPANWAGPVTDSYHDFLGGIYALTHAPFYRPIDLKSPDQSMDEKVMLRSRSDAAYRPQNPGFPPLLIA